LFVSLLLWPYI